MPDDPVDVMRNHLDTQGLGDRQAFAFLLASAWEHLSGSSETSMRSDKVARLEEPSWSLPLLTFTIERHGGAVVGSSGAELQRWCVNLDDRTADYTFLGFRQLTPARKPLDVTPIAHQIATAVVEGRDDPRLQWGRDRTSVRVLSTMAVNVDNASKETVDGRRNGSTPSFPQYSRARGDSASQPGRYVRQTPWS